MSPLAHFDPALILFDKDGTLIDFNFMWASWVTELARRLETAAKRPLAAALYKSMGFDAGRGKVIAGSPLAAHSMANLYARTEAVVEHSGLSREAAQRATAESWFIPDPIAFARPVGDAVRVFSALRQRGIRIGVVTSDDRAPTVLTLEALGLAQLTDVLVCADDGLPNKPAPDMLLHACRTLNIPPQQAMVVGDAAADMHAGRAAGAGLCVGVLSGLSSREILAPDADVIIDTLDALIKVEN